MGRRWGCLILGAAMQRVFRGAAVRVMVTAACPGIGCRICPIWRGDNTTSPRLCCKSFGLCPANDMESNTRHLLGARTENLRQLAISQQPTFLVRQLHGCSELIAADPDSECGAERHGKDTKKASKKQRGGIFSETKWFLDRSLLVCLVGLSRDIGRCPTDDASGWALVNLGCCQAACICHSASQFYAILPTCCVPLL